MSAQPPTLEIKDFEREPLQDALTALMSSVADEEVRRPYRELYEAAGEGIVPEYLFTALETVLEMTLQSGRARHHESPQVEQILQRLFNRTPRGIETRSSISETNRAIAALQGQIVDTCSISSNSPGVYRMKFDTDRCQITLEFNESTVSVTSVNIGV